MLVQVVEGGLRLVLGSLALDCWRVEGTNIDMEARNTTHGTYKGEPMNMAPTAVGAGVPSDVAARKEVTVIYRLQQNW